MKLAFVLLESRGKGVPVANVQKSQNQVGGKRRRVADASC